MFFFRLFQSAPSLAKDEPHALAASVPKKCRFQSASFFTKDESKLTGL